MKLLINQYVKLHQDETKYKLPDGDEILISDELLNCTEILFNPQLYKL